MPTAELLEALPDKTVLGTVPPALRGLAYDSRKVAPGELFVAIPGLKQDGRRFIADALGRGAAAVVFDGPDVLAGSETGRVMVPSAREALARLADAYFGHPSRALTVVGITGTNGKTTTSYILTSIFEAAGVTCDWRDPDVIRVAPVPLYNRYGEVRRFVEILREAI